MFSNGKLIPFESTLYDEPKNHLDFFPNPKPNIFEDGI
jgi:hypothetical protein